MTIMTLTAAETHLAELRSQYEQGRGRLALLEQQRASKEFARDEARKNVDEWRLVQALFTRVSDYARVQLKQRVEETVTAALQAVFATDAIRFEISMHEVGGKPTADWSVVSRYADMEIAQQPEDGRGGGVVDVVSLALRLALMELSRPKPGGPLLLDEVGKHVSSEYAPNMAEFVKQYARKTGRQVLLITHQSALAEVADKAFRVSMNERGISEVTPL